MIIELLKDKRCEVCGGALTKIGEDCAAWMLDKIMGFDSPHWAAEGLKQKPTLEGNEEYVK